MMDDTFIREMPRTQASTTPNYPGSAGKPRGLSSQPDQQQAYTVFDSFSLGFELPAGIQLNRISKKLDRW